MAAAYRPYTPVPWRAPDCAQGARIGETFNHDFNHILLHKLWTSILQVRSHFWR